MVCIFRFVKNQNKIVQGLSKEAKSKRRQRNLVTMKFNFLNWMLETITILIVVINPNELMNVIYNFVNSSGTPLVYFLGIEENRKAMKQNLVTKMNVAHKMLTPGQDQEQKVDNENKTKTVPENRESRF